MASTLPCMFYLLIVATTLNIHVGSSLHVVVDPEHFNEVVTNELTIKCLDNGSLPMVKQVVMLELWKKDQSPLVIVRQDELTSGPGIRANMKAVGHVEKNATNSYLQLTIKNPAIEDAGTYTCVIFYLNDLYQLKEVKVTGKATVKVDESDITDVVAYLMGQLSILKKTTKQQEELISKLRSVIHGEDGTLKRMEGQLTEHDKLFTQHDKHLTAHDTLFHEQVNKDKDLEMKLSHQNNSITANQQRIESQARQLMDQERFSRELEGNDKDLEMKLSHQNNSLTANQQRIESQARQLMDQERFSRELERNDKDLEMKLSHQNNSITANEQRIESQARQLMDQERYSRELEGNVSHQNNSITANQQRIESQAIQLMDQERYSRELEGNATFSSAFSYGYNNENKFTTGQTILFSDRIMSVGDDYDPSTGMFTAPRDGLYTFHLVAMTYTSGANVYFSIALQASGNTVATLYVYGYSRQEQSSVSSVVSLKEGEKVWPVVTGIGQGSQLYQSGNNFYSVFTGYLLRLS